MARASGVTLTIEAEQVPVFNGVLAIARPTAQAAWLRTRSILPAASRSTRGVDADRTAVLYDPQTSGGLLVAASAESRGQVAAALAAAGVAALPNRRRRASPAAGPRPVHA